MKRKYNIAILFLTLILCLSGCMGRNLSPQQGQDNSTNMISASFEKADVDYTIVKVDTPVKGGASATSTTVHTLKAGTNVKVLGKTDGWYVVYPTTNIVGFIPIQNTNPVTTSTPQTVPDVQKTQGVTPAATDETSMLSLVNAERAKVGAAALTINPQLTKLAQLKSQDIATNNYFSHISPTYGSPFEMLKKYGVSYLYAGENLAKNATVQAAHQALMNSPGHKKNILNTDFNQVGIGVVSKNDGSKIYTQMFIGR